MRARTKFAIVAALYAAVAGTAPAWAQDIPRLLDQLDQRHDDRRAYDRGREDAERDRGYGYSQARRPAPVYRPRQAVPPRDPRVRGFDPRGPALDATPPHDHE